MPPHTTTPPNSDDLDPDDDTFNRRGELEKRGKKQKITAFSISGGLTCDLTTTNNQPSLTRPPWPSVKVEMLAPEAAGVMPTKFGVISRYDRATRTGPCSVPTMTRVDAAAFLAASAAGPAYTNYAGETKDNNNDASLDHACELPRWTLRKTCNVPRAS